MDDKNIEAQVNAKYLKGFVESSIESPKSYFRMSGVSFSKEGSSFSLLFGKNKISMKVPLFGYVHIRNLVLAMNAAKTIGMKDKDIIEAIHDIKQVPSRLELVHKGSSTVVNNTYSSNFVGFMELLETAKTVNGRKALLTPGIVELGPKEEEIHKKMGSLASDIFDKLILVGKNSRTISIAAGVKNKQRLTYIEDSRRSYRDYIKSLYGKYDWIFLENDVTQNY
jgi:UDP-N-acetylmuramoyl-tripeptide--D-alanyl-D-alanine ligase